MFGVPIKKFGTVTFIAALLSVSVPYTSSATPVYSDTNLPSLKSLKFEVLIENSKKLKVRMQIGVETKINPLKTLQFNFFSPPSNPLEPPCGTGNNATALYWKLNDDQIKANGLQNFVFERIIDVERICVGTYSLLDPGKKWVTEISLGDVADHVIEYRVVSNPAPTAYKGSPIWSVAGVAQPNCLKDATAYAFPRYLLCDENIDLVEMLSRATVTITKNNIDEAVFKAEAEAKAKAEAEAKAKAETTKKKTTITCVKGKLTKKVSAVNPKCPAGYRKK